MLELIENMNDIAVFISFRMFVMSLTFCDKVAVQSIYSAKILTPGVASGDVTWFSAVSF